MKRRTLLIIIILSKGWYAYSQQSVRSFVIPKSGEVTVSEIKFDLSPILLNISGNEPDEMPKPDGNIFSKHLSFLKQSRENSRFKTELQDSIVHNQPNPKQLRNFEGSVFDGLGTPTDNDLAISNNGKIISVVNSSFHVYDSTGYLLKKVSLQAFADTLNIKQSKYDPRTLYDPYSDKFIVVFLNGYTDSTSKIVIGFSETNDPTGKWNFYVLSGEPLNDTTWSDYPIIALTQGELFLTINALQNNKSWQLGFKQTYIWRIKLSDGYSGNSLKPKLYSGINLNGKNIRNLCPVQGGSYPQNPGSIYFLSDKNFSSGSDSLILVNLDLINPNSFPKVNLLKTSGSYAFPPVAHQPFQNTFETNDARILDAFIENNTIQFVGNTLNRSTGLASVFHGILHLYETPLRPNLNILGESSLDLGFPSIAYLGRNSEEDDAIIFVNHSSDTSKAGNSCYLYSHNAYSNLLKLKFGLNHVNFLPGPYERWGDYSGAQTKYNEQGKCWVAGSFGRKNGSGINQVYSFGTWISEIENPSIITNKVENSELSMFPNPVLKNNIFTVSFNAKPGNINFYLYDSNGKLIKTLLEERVIEGKNRFSINTSQLSGGVYYLKCVGNTSFKTKKIIVKN